MSELETFGAHARAMSTAAHKVECHGQATCVYASVVPPCSRFSCEGGCVSTTIPHPDPACPGCVSDADRALWARLAAEVAAHLHTGEEARLFG